MAIDTDTLKTLQSIENLLKGASVLTDSKRLNSADRNKQTASQKAGKDAKKIYQATADRAKELGDTMMGLNKSMFGLNTQVGNVTTSFGSLHSQMSKFMSSLTPITAPIEGATAPLNTQFQQLVAVGNRANEYLKIIAGASAIGAGIGSMQSVQQQGADLVGQVGKGISKGIRPTVNDIDKLNIPFKTQLGQMIDNFGNTSNALGGLGIAASNVKDILKKLTGDFFSLASVGMGSVANLTELSKSALLSGMSLKEYQTVIKDNITVASRSGSLENFNKIISAADSQLASIGVFGMEARQMQASLAESSTLMGIKQANLTDVIAGQISVFDQLRKSTNMTAEEFSGLVKTVSDNEQAQRELQGLTPFERVARQQELLNTASIGAKMGLAAEASQKLATAMLEARGETVKGRIETAGRVRQLGQLVGMGAEAERAAQLNMKGRNRTSAEDAELAQLASGLKMAAEARYQEGSLGMQNALDFFNGEGLGNTRFGKVMEEAGKAGLAQDSGTVNQEAFGKHVGEFGQFVAEMLKYARGINESFGPMVAGLVGGISMALFRGPIIKALQAGAGKFGIGGAKAAAGTASTAKSGIGVVQGFKNASSLVGPAIATLSTGLDAGAAVLKGFWKFAKGLSVASVFLDAVIEAVTGDIANALNPSGGFFNRIGGVITSAFSAIPNLVIDLLGFVFGEEMFVGRLRNSFDTIVSFMNMAVKDFLARMLGGVGGILKKLLPDDSKLVKFFESTSEGLQNSAMENAVAVEKLTTDNTLTLKKMSASNEEAAKKTQDSTVKATTAQSKFNNVQSGMILSQASLLADGQTLIGSPQVQVPNAVKPTTVNTPDEQTQQNTTKQSQAELQSNTDLLAALNSILTVMRESLSNEQKQVELTEMLLRSNRPQASFPSSELTANLLLKGQAS